MNRYVLTAIDQAKIANTQPSLVSLNHRRSLDRAHLPGVCRCRSVPSCCPTHTQFPTLADEIEKDLQPYGDDAILPISPKGADNTPFEGAGWTSSRLTRQFCWSAPSLFSVRIAHADSRDVQVSIYLRVTPAFSKLLRLLTPHESMPPRKKHLEVDIFNLGSSLP